MDLTKFDQYIDGHNVDEQNKEKKESMYREGAYSMSSAFREFSQNYMRAMGLLIQGKKDTHFAKYKKSRDKIATAYERMDDAISKHIEEINKDAEAKMKATRR